VIAPPITHIRNLGPVFLDRSCGYPARMLRYLVHAALCGGLAAGVTVAGAAQARPRGLEGATILLTADEGTQGVEIVAQCLSEAGLRQAAPADYLVQFSRALRPRKTAVELAAKDAAPAPRRKLRSGRTVEVATVAISEVASGKVLRRAEVVAKVRRRGRTPDAIVRKLCDVIKRSVAEPG